MIVDIDGRIVELDHISSDYNKGYLVSLSSTHHKIHEGMHFDCQDIDTDIDIASPKYWLIRAPNTTTRVHMTFQIRPSGPGTAELFENPTTTADGTQLTAKNNDRNSSNTPECEIYYDPTVSAAGTRLCVNWIGSAGVNPTAGVGGVAIREDEIIFGQGLDYLVKYTPNSDNQISSICFGWYEVIEHPNNGP